MIRIQKLWKVSKRTKVNPQIIISFEVPYKCSRITLNNVVVKAFED